MNFSKIIKYRIERFNNDYKYTFYNHHSLKNDYVYAYFKFLNRIL